MTPQTSSGLSDSELAELEYLLGRQLSGEGLADFIRRISPHRPPPPHMAPVIDLLERAIRGEEIRACISMPPRHAKTVAILHALAWWVSRSPEDTCAYFAYNETLGRSKSRLARDLALRAGVQLRDDSASVAEWRTKRGGGLLAGGIGGGLTGQGISGLLAIDDPFKSREDADSQLARDRVWEWFTDVAMTRLEGASVVVVQTRWHPDDLIGRLEKKGGWEIVNLPAIAEESDPLGRAPGEALWPDVRPLEKLQRTRALIGEFSWASLYQGQPRPRGAHVFGEPHYYDPATFAMEGCRIVLAADPAASAKTSADYSAAVVLAIRGFAEQAVGYLLHVYREQVSVPQFARDLVALQTRFGGATINVETVGAFKAIPQMLLEVHPDLRINEIQPVGDKFTRAQPVAAAWNGARVLVPSDNPPWLAPFLAEATTFTGVNDAHDDQVDALSSAWNNQPTPNMWDVL